MMECQFDTLIGVEDVPVLHLEPELLVLLIRLLAGPELHGSLLSYLQSQHLGQILLVIYSIEYCICAGRVVD